MLEMDNEFKDDDIWFVGGDGDSMTDAVIVQTKDPFAGVRAEKRFISSRFGQEGSDWFFDTQKLFFVDGKAFDLITFWLADGSLEQVYFNVTEFYGNE
ncbi:hypothetical protein ACFL36_01230 [Thermodesulfobacteriota bacterium]